VSCGEPFLPFDEENRNCPKCGKPAKAIAQLIPDIVEAALYNNSFAAFGIWGTGDYYVSMAMHALRRILEANIALPKTDEDLELVTDKVLKFFVFKDNYRIPHIRAFIQAVLRKAYLNKNS